MTILSGGAVLLAFYGGRYATYPNSLGRQLGHLGNAERWFSSFS